MVKGRLINALGWRHGSRRASARREACKEDIQKPRPLRVHHARAADSRESENARQDGCKFGGAFRRLVTAEGAQSGHGARSPRSRSTGTSTCRGKTLDQATIML